VGTEDGPGMGDAEAVVVDRNRTRAAGMRRADITKTIGSGERECCQLVERVGFVGIVHVDETQLKLGVVSGGVSK